MAVLHEESALRVEAAGIYVTQKVVIRHGSKFLRQHPVLRLPISRVTRGGIRNRSVHSLAIRSDGERDRWRLVGNLLDHIALRRGGFRQDTLHRAVHQLRALGRHAVEDLLRGDDRVSGGRTDRQVVDDILRGVGDDVVDGLLRRVGQTLLRRFLGSAAG